MNSNSSVTIPESEGSGQAIRALVLELVEGPTLTDRILSRRWITPTLAPSTRSTRPKTGSSLSSRLTVRGETLTARIARGPRALEEIDVINEERRASWNT